MIKLRKKGLSYNQISDLTNIPKSTLSDWLSDLPLSKIAKKKNLAKARLIWAKNIIAFNKKRSREYKRRTAKEIKRYANEIKKINKNQLFYLGLGLFMAEGGRREKWMVRFVNSDPDIVKIIMKFFRKICKVKNKDFRLRIHLHHNISNNKAMKYWSKITRVPINQFWQPQILQSKVSRQKRPYNRLPYGTLHITIMSAKLNRRIKGWISGVASQF
ncbi:MAG: Uncharacterized protein CEN92_380 [Candidatus Berkelbacteria bacterium Licking1014_96]|uniref:Uncharacterized protein n=1 Tax=Candidatus Berkelbacteria bacterium Licking1014_96 TaxID=2017149 RepID=A0A554LDQ5_9BACT|nr:MAG: Uncharacterized protein CEN92_380 [Candidatus Berkelbacteria bacterium Licking1014_96]